MPAIITNDTKKLLIEKIIADTADSDTRYFIGIGRSDTWQDSTDVAPIATQIINSPREETNFRTNLQSAALTATVSFVSPRYNWSSGTIYRAYEGDVSAAGNGSSNDVGNGRYYVITENNRVYICLQQGRTATGQINPSLNNPGDEILPSEGTKLLGDGYVWRFLTLLDPAKLNNFATANFLPVEKILDSGQSAAEQLQKAAQDAAVAGEITGYKIVSGGAGYATTSTATIEGNGTGATIKLTASPTTGAIVRAEVDSNGSGGFGFGSGYDYANVKITSSSTPTSAAVIRPTISTNGVGADPRDDLRSTAIMFNSRLVGAAGSGDFLVDQEFRQVGLMRNLLKINDSDFTDVTGNALRKLTVSGNDLTKDMTIQGGASGAKAFVDEAVVDSSTTILYYHQNEKTGFTQFTSADSGANAIFDVLNPTTKTGDFVSDSDGEFNPFSGELLYLDNRAAIERDSASTEDVKIIIQF